MAKRFSSGGSSLRKSLGMPLRENIGPSSVDTQWKQRTSKVSGVAGGMRLSSGHKSSQSQQQQYTRRQTYTASSGRSTSFGISSQQRQTQTGLNSSRPSAGRTSLYGSSSQMKKDPRPLSEKSYQISMIKKVIKFLAENGYPKTLTVKGLQTPTCREFLHIFNFLLEHIDESLVIDGMNIVEEVPSVLKTLGYPFTVSKNHLLNVGSPHSWPILLGAISWLMDCCSFSDNTSRIMFPQGDGFEEEDNNTEELEYKVEELMYFKYMYHGENSNEYQSLQAERISAVQMECEHFEIENDRLKNETSELSEAINTLSKSSLPVLQNQEQQNYSDYEELKCHLENELIPAIESVERARAEADERASEVEVQIPSSKGKIKELEKQIRKQPMSSNDAHDLHQSIKDTEDMLEKKRLQQEESIKRVSELQIQHNKSVLLIDTQCQQINGKLHRLSAILPDVASLSSLDYDTSKRADPQVLQKLITHAKLLGEDIQKLHQGVASSILDIEGNIISADSNQSTFHTELVRKQLEIDNLQHTLDITKKTLNQKRKLNEEAMKSELTEKHALEKSMLALQQRLQGDPQAQKNYITIHQKCESEVIAMAEEMQSEDEGLKELIMMITKFIETLQEHQDGVNRAVAELVEHYKKLKIPTVHPKYLAPLQLV